MRDLLHKQVCPSIGGRNGAVVSRVRAGSCWDIGLWKKPPRRTAFTTKASRQKLGIPLLFNCTLDADLCASTVGGFPAALSSKLNT